MSSRKFSDSVSLVSLSAIDIWGMDPDSLSPSPIISYSFPPTRAVFAR